MSGLIIIKRLWAATLLLSHYCTYDCIANKSAKQLLNMAVFIKVSEYVCAGYVCESLRV